MNKHKFDISKIEMLDNPDRLNILDLKKITKELELQPNCVFVDIGAGTGIFSQKLLELIPGSTGYGFDISDEMVNWMKKNRVPNLNSRLKVDLMKESEIPLSDGFVDLVVMITVYHELNDELNLLKDVNRILKRNGKLLICDWKEGSHKHFIKKESIINDLNNSNFGEIKEIDASDRMNCLSAIKF